MSPCSVCCMASAALISPRMASYKPARVISARMTYEILPCGSVSMMSALYPLWFSPVANACAVVVLPTPPF